MYLYFLKLIKMPDNVKPSLSTDGWIANSALKLDDLLADFYYSEFSQSTIYYGNVASLPYIIQNNRNDPVGTANSIKTTLQLYLNRYFNSVTVDCSASYDTDDQGKASVKLYVETTDAAGKTQTMSKLLFFLNSKFIKAMDIRIGE